MREVLIQSDEIGESAKLGEALTIVSHHFGSVVDNSRLLQIAKEYTEVPDQLDLIQRAITSTGFTHRYISKFPEVPFNLEEGLDRVTEIGATLLKRVLKSHGWERPDVFIDTSAFLPSDINKRILETAGFKENTIISKSYRYACAGAVGAFIDIVSDPGYKKARVVIGALEPLSWLIDKNQFTSPSRIVIPSIFGDSYTFMAFNPANFYLANKQILIKPDGGVMKLRTFYDFDETALGSVSPPPHYKFSEGGEDIFHYLSSGAYLKIHTPNFPDLATSDGVATGMFFGDNTSDLLKFLLMDYGDANLLRELGGKNLIIHPASKPVVDRIAKLMRRGGFLDTPEIPFLMDKAKLSNSSSATTLNRLKYMIENNFIDPNKPVVWLAPGIGSAIAGAIGWIKI